MRKALIILPVFLLIAFSLSSCSEENNSDAEINIVFTSFAPYDWTREIIKGNEAFFELTLLNDDGSDIHNYQPTVDDMLTIKDADLFVYTGGGSESWVRDIDTDAVCISLMDELGLNGEKHDHGTESCSDDHSAEEHIWLSVSYAIDLVGIIKDEIISLDHNNAELYSDNHLRYCEKLGELYDINGLAGFSEADGTRVIFADRYPFYYLMEDLGIEVYSAFSGCSTESGADIETQLSLTEELKNNAIDAVLVLENSDREIAKSIISESGKSDCRILEMNSMQSVTTEDIKSGLSYYDAMSDNLSAIYIALY